MVRAKRSVEIENNPALEDALGARAQYADWQLVTDKQVAEFLGIGLTKARELMNGDAIPAVYIGTAKRVAIGKLRAYVARLYAEQQAPDADGRPARCNAGTGMSLDINPRAALRRIDRYSAAHGAIG